MHPHIKLQKPGKCPICFMDLIAVYEGAQMSEEGPVLVLSERARQLAEIETVPVERKELSVSVRMVGKVAYDETRLAYVTA